MGSGRRIVKSHLNVLDSREMGILAGFRYRGEVGNALVECFGGLSPWLTAANQWMSSSAFGMQSFLSWLRGVQSIPNWSPRVTKPSIQTIFVYFLVRRLRPNEFFDWNVWDIGIVCAEGGQRAAGGSHDSARLDQYFTNKLIPIV
jgi:hypothetical protein